MSTAVITFSHDVLVQGEELKAGKYGLHLIVEETGPWTWIFRFRFMDLA